MKFKMIHENYNVQDLDQSLRFYAEALGLHELRRMEAEDGSYSIVSVSYTPLVVSKIKAAGGRHLRPLPRPGPHRDGCLL